MYYSGKTNKVPSVVIVRHTPHAGTAYILEGEILALTEGLKCSPGATPSSS
jgi:hypothetical protein